MTDGGRPVESYFGRPAASSRSSAHKGVDGIRIATRKRDGWARKMTGWGPPTWLKPGDIAHEDSVAARPVGGSIKGPLQRRETTREGAAEDGQGGDVTGSQGLLRGTPGTNEGSGRSARA